MEKFKVLGLIEPILESIKRENITEPTDIQAKAIPLVIEGQDIIAGSATGSGKTIAFAAGAIQNIEKGKGIQLLVMTPTRELAEQVSRVCRMLSKWNGLHVCEVFGGVSINPQINNLKRSEIVVGTPGRILDHIGRRTIDLKKIKTLVLDEADRMFDMGFIIDVEKIIKECSKERQTLLFSATINEGVAKIASKYMKNPVKVQAGEYVDPKKLKQIYYDVADNQKFSLLVHLLREERTGLVMVFCNSRRTVDFVDKNLKSNGIKAHALHGGFTQNKRSRTLEDFHSNKANILVCTDVAARGLDIKGVTHVYNYDIPKDSKEYVHRIGRTARAGSEGIAVNLLCPRDHANYSRVLRDNDVEVDKVDLPKLERVHVKRVESQHYGSRGYGGHRGHRGSNGGHRRMGHRHH